ncbi:MAG: hypothetical protein C4576_13540 [Desulfobacteraceae bacterium]|nr:MAG: hypothetical protein C4576_13540 [Desulfobacteraceae bacterium]
MIHGHEIPQKMEKEEADAIDRKIPPFQNPVHTAHYCIMAARVKAEFGILPVQRLWSARLSSFLFQDEQFVSAFVNHPDCRFDRDKGTLRYGQVAAVIEFEHAEVLGNPSEAFSLRWPVNGGSPKSKWGTYVGARPLGESDFMFEQYVTYRLKETNEIWQKWVTRNELKGLMGKGFKWVVSKALQLPKKEYLAAIRTWHDENQEEEIRQMFSEKRKTLSMFHRPIEEIILDRTGLTWDELWRAARNGNYQYIEKLAREGKLAQEEDVPGRSHYPRKVGKEAFQQVKEIQQSLFDMEVF